MVRRSGDEERGRSRHGPRSSSADRQHLRQVRLHEPDREATHGRLRARHGGPAGPRSTRLDHRRGLRRGRAHGAMGEADAGTGRRRRPRRPQAAGRVGAPRSTQPRVPRRIWRQASIRRRGVRGSNRNGGPRARPRPACRARRDGAGRVALANGQRPP